MGVLPEPATALGPLASPRRGCRPPTPSFLLWPGSAASLDFACLPGREGNLGGLHPWPSLPHPFHPAPVLRVASSGASSHLLLSASPLAGSELSGLISQAEPWNISKLLQLSLSRSTELADVSSAAVCLESPPPTLPPSTPKLGIRGWLEDPAL